MGAPEPHGYPYSKIVAPLVASIMRAAASILKHVTSGRDLSTIPPGIINREFVWLAQMTPDGKNRHLIEPPEGMASLRNSKLRAKSGFPDDVRSILRQMAAGTAGTSGNAVDLDRNWDALAPYIQEQSTRISALMIEAFQGLSFAKSRSRTGPSDANHGVESMSNLEEGGKQSGTTGIAIAGIPSPLAIAYDFLTVPDMPGTRAFSLLACRNLLFSEFLLVPNIGLQKETASFSITQVEDAVSVLWTSMRTRYNSRGQDKLPPGRQGDVNGLIRHYLSMRGMLHLHFRSIRDSINYFERANLLPQRKTDHYEFEFGRSVFLEKLPEVGEIINELWGLPIPIRGADTILRGGLKFSTRQGLVIAIHGGPGSGKTSLALALAAYIAPFGIETLYLTAEEIGTDLIERVAGLVPDEVKRLDFFPVRIESSIRFEHLPLSDEIGVDRLQVVEIALNELAAALKIEEAAGPTADFRVPKVCNSVIVLDGVHDLFAAGSADSSNAHRADQISRLYRLIEILRGLRALVVVTTGINWAGDSALDYLVDMAIRLNFESVEDYGSKPDRRFTLSKARHQLCASGTHGFQIAGKQGVRFSPQINYQLDRRSFWKARLPNKEIVRTSLRRATQSSHEGAVRAGYVNSIHSVDVFDGSHIFLNGQGSGGKAALALRLALSPVAARYHADDKHMFRREKILVISFLYPAEYYDHLHKRLETTLLKEYIDVAPKRRVNSRLSVLHLYPGHLRPHNLYNRIEWELEAAEINGDPYTCVIIDGIHNVFLQFPEIERYSLFWPQMYSSLRSRSLTTISTHTTLALPYASNDGRLSSAIDDRRSEPLRHALIQKSDFQFEIDPWMSSPFRDWGTSPEELLKYSNLYLFKVVSSLDQRLPTGYLLWNREDHNFSEFPYLPGTRTQERLF